MTAAAAFFYLFAVITVASGFMVIASRNPVALGAVPDPRLLNAAGLFVLMGAEFLAMMLVVVYVGAVAVLFLFVVMMLDVDFAELRQGFPQYLPVGAPDRRDLPGRDDAGGRRLDASIRASCRRRSATSRRPSTSPTPRRSAGCSTRDYVYFFQAAGLVLLVAMIGAIVLTLRHRPGVKRQNIAVQIARTQADGGGDSQGARRARASEAMTQA